MTEEQANVKEVYTRAWRRMLDVFLNWPDDRITDWVRQWDARFDDPDALINHETAEWYITPLLIPVSLDARLGQNVFREKLEQAIRAGPVGQPDPVDDYDWIAARARVEHVLAEHGAWLVSLRTARVAVSTVRFARS